MHTDIRFSSAWSAAGIALAALAIGPNASARDQAVEVVTRFSPATMIIEFNSSAADIGIQFFLDADSWASVEIRDPEGVEIFSADSEGSLTEQGGGTELFLESVEPTLADLPLAEFFARFPAGTYRFRGRTPEGDLLVGRAQFSHVIPSGPEVLTPVGSGGGCAANVAIPTVIAWNPVTTSIGGNPIDIVGYQVIVEGGNDHFNFDVHLPAAAGTLLNVPAELLEPGTDYLFEVLAIEEGGNQTITEGCFTTAD